MDHKSGPCNWYIGYTLHSTYRVNTIQHTTTRRKNMLEICVCVCVHDNKDERDMMWMKA